MSIQRIESSNYGSLINYSQNINNSSVVVPGFKKILNTVPSQQTGKAETFVSGERSLKELYPGLKYQILDANQFSYFNRLDFPTAKLYGDTIDENTVNELKSWKPKTQTSSGYEPWVQKELEKIPNNAHVVLINPDVQKKMEQDSDYAKKIVAKIQKYFDDDIRMNASIDPESVKSMSQLVSITKEGEIGYHETVCDGPSAKNSGNQKDENQIQSKGKEQSLLKGLQNTSLTTSLPLLDKIQLTILKNDYNYAYQINGLYQKRKTKSRETF